MSASRLLPYDDRRQAGRALAEVLRSRFPEGARTLVLALPRGGVPVAYEVARALRAPLDVFVVRKLGLPGQEEYALGAIAGGGTRVLNPEAVEALGIPGSLIERVAQREQVELLRRERRYRGDRSFPDVAGRTVLLIDDGLATGSTMRAAVAALRARRPGRLVVAVPVAAPETCQTLGREVDEVVCAATPQPFVAVGLWYRDFQQTEDEEVRELLDANRRELGVEEAAGAPAT